MPRKLEDAEERKQKHPSLLGGALLIWYRCDYLRLSPNFAINSLFWDLSASA